jgi:hypothetical protein
MLLEYILRLYNVDSNDNQLWPELMSELIDFYKRSPEFAGLAPATRRTYDIAFLKFAQIKIFKMPLEVIESQGSPIIIHIRDRIFRDSGLAAGKLFGNGLAPALLLGQAVWAH